MNETEQTADQEKGGSGRSFLPLYVTNFFGTLNDNKLKSNFLFRDNQDHTGAKIGLTTLFMPDNTLLQTRLLQMPIRIATTSNPNYASILRSVSILLLIFPLMIIYLICQRFFVESVERSGIVG